MMANKKYLVIILFMALWANDSNAQYQTILIPPSLEMKLDTTVWRKVINKSKYQEEFNKVSFESSLNKSLTLRMVCDGFTVGIDSVKRIIAAYKTQKQTEAKDVEVSEKNGFTVIKYSDKNGIESGRKYHCEFMGIHPEGFTAVLFFEAPESNKAILDSLVNGSIKDFHVVSANYVDQKFGYPIKESNKEVQVEKRMEKLMAAILEKNPSFHPDEAGLDELNNEARRQLDKDIKWGYSYQKYYSTRKKIALGNLSLNDWLEVRFGTKESDDISFLKAYNSGQQNEFIDGFNRAVSRTFGDTLQINYLADPMEIEHKTKKLFWTFCFPSKPIKDSTTIIVFCFSYDTISTQWDANKAVVSKMAASREETNGFKIVKHNTGESEFDNITADFIVIADDSGKFIIGNNTMQNSNFIKSNFSIPDMDNYKMIAKGVNLVKDKLTYAEMTSSDGSDELQGLKYIQPDKRLYQSSLQFDDLRDDGIQMAFYYTVNKGKLLSGKIFANSDKGIKELPLDDMMKGKIMQTDLFKKLLKESLQTTTGLIK